jgi:hypothetical protein
MKTLLLLVAVFVLASVSSTACSSPRNFTIATASDKFVVARISKIGSLDVLRDPTYEGARKAFGAATSCTPAHIDVATARWGKIGLTIRLATYGSLPHGRNVCTAPDRGKIDRATMTGSAWRSAQGLRIGDTLAQLRKRYPDAKLHSGIWWLIIAKGYIGANSPNEYPVLSARVRDGRVTSFIAVVGAQGE